MDRKQRQIKNAFNKLSNDIDEKNSISNILADGVQETSESLKKAGSTLSNYINTQTTEMSQKSVTENLEQGFKNVKSWFISNNTQTPEVEKQKSFTKEVQTRKRQHGKNDDEFPSR